MKRLKKWTKAQTMLFIMAAMGAVFLLVFNYAPMFGIMLAFKKGDYVINIKNAIFHSEWVGWENFEKFLTDPEFKDVVINTLGLNVLSLVFTFPAPIIFALLVNELKNGRFKKGVQTISYFPYFLSWAVYGGIILSLIDPQTGLVNEVLLRLGLTSEPVNFGRSEYFWGLMIVTALLKGIALFIMYFLWDLSFWPSC